MGLISAYTKYMIYLSLYKPWKISQLMVKVIEFSEIHSGGVRYNVFWTHTHTHTHIYIYISYVCICVKKYIHYDEG
jgi:hypothetical protein